MNQRPRKRKHNIIIDTDGGYDDLFAITLLLGSRKQYNVHIPTITTVHGMTNDTEQCATNIRRLLQKFTTNQHHHHDKDNISTIVVAGATVPDDGGHSIMESEWGRDYISMYKKRMEDLHLPPLESNNKMMEVPPSKAHAANALAEALSKSCQEVDSRGNPVDTTLLSLGPLTNINAAISQLLDSTTSSSSSSNILSPSNWKSKPNFVIMGGAVHTKGNAGPDNQAEFNMYMNPNASHNAIRSANAIFESIYMVDLSTANEKYCPRTNEWIQTILKHSERHSELYSSMTSAVRELLSTLIQIEPSCSGYDPIAAAFVLDPSIIKTVPIYITVDSKSGVTTVIMENQDLSEVNTDNKVAKIDLGTELNMEGYHEIIKNVMVDHE